MYYAIDLKNGTFFCDDGNCKTLREFMKYAKKEEQDSGIYADDKDYCFYIEPNKKYCVLFWFNNGVCSEPTAETMDGKQFKKLYENTDVEIERVFEPHKLYRIN